MDGLERVVTIEELRIQRQSRRLWLGYFLVAILAGLLIAAAHTIGQEHERLDHQLEQLRRPGPEPKTPPASSGSTSSPGTTS